MRSRRQAREYAVQLLYMCDVLETFDDTQIQIFRDHFVKSSEDSSEELDAFFELLAKGAMQHSVAIGDALCRASNNWDVSRMARVDRNILRVAAYEILYRDDIPNTVSINEAIEIAKRFGADDSPTFINGVLDKLAQLSQHDPEPKKAVNE